MIYVRSNLLGRSFTNLRIISRFMVEETNDHPEDITALRFEVKDLYKKLIYLGRDWHYDLKPQIKSAFMKNKNVTDPKEIRELIEKGEYVSREIVATYRLKKYRALKRRYYSEDENQHLQDIFKSFNS